MGEKQNHQKVVAINQWKVVTHIDMHSDIL